MVLSRLIEVHQRIEEINRIISLIREIEGILDFMALIVAMKNMFALIDVMKGHGLCSTRWNMLFFIRFLR